MCCCRTHHVNGTVSAYSWDGKSFSTYTPSPPELAEGDELIYDSPGRCGGDTFRGHATTLDCHSHHFRVVKSFGSYYLLVRHGAGTERINLWRRPGLAALERADENGRYWLLQMLFETHSAAALEALQTERKRWGMAALERRIKVNRRGRRHTVEILPEPAPGGVAA